MSDPKRLVLALALLTACGGAQEERVDSPLRFEDAAADFGLDVRHVASRSRDKWLPEVMGSGVAIADFDRDGAPDLYVVGGGERDSSARPAGARDHLFLNDGRGRFREVSDAWGLGGVGFGMGIAAGDYDGDGFVDVYLTSHGGGDRLLRNTGDGFEDVTERARIPQDGLWTTSAGFFDLENDGDLDLYVVRYVRYDRDTILPCFHNGRRIYCSPDLFDALPDKVLRNEGDGTFTDVSAECGVGATRGKGLALVIGDVDRDGDADVYVANDITPNLLFLNRGDGRFDECAGTTGAAYDETGRAAAGMGADLSDVAGDGRWAIACTNFQGETANLFEQVRPLVFRDRVAARGLGNSAQRLSFGIDFFDADGDGDEDLLVANGHIDDGIEGVSAEVGFAQPDSLYLRREDGSFEDVSERAGSALAFVDVSRGLATGDLDGDRRLDFVVTTNGGPLRIGRNANRGGDAVVLWLEGVRANPSAIGAYVEARAGSRVVRREVRGASSYLSVCDFRVHLGLGDAGAFDEVLVRWPGGGEQRFTKLGPGFYHLVEGAQPRPFTPGEHRIEPPPRED